MDTSTCGVFQSLAKKVWILQSEKPQQNLEDIFGMSKKKKKNIIIAIFTFCSPSVCSTIKVQQWLSLESF